MADAASTSSILYDPAALDAADARAWTSSRLSRVAVPASDALQRYWEAARDTRRSGELYGTVDTYQTFSPCPVDVFDSVEAVLIRKEYEAAWRDLESSFIAGRKHFDPEEVATRYEGHPTPTPVAPYPRAYTITGSPGIGKTLFLALALLSCLERHWTVVLQTNPSFLYIFNSAGVWKVRAEDMDMVDSWYALPKATWWLLDSNDALTSVPQLTIDLGFFIVQAALPETRRTAWQTKTCMITKDYVMRPMSVAEAQVAFSLSRVPDVGRTEETDRVIRNAFEKYGPDTRLAFRVVSRGEDSQGVEMQDDWEDEPAARLDAVLSGLDGIAKLQRLLRLASCSRIDEDSAHAILVVLPGKTRSCAQVDFVSPYVRGRCLEAFPGLDLSDIEGA